MQISRVLFFRIFVKTFAASLISKCLKQILNSMTVLQLLHRKKPKSVRGPFQKIKSTNLALGPNLTLSRGGGPELTIQGGVKNTCATYFRRISSMEARIFMQFETYIHKTSKKVILFTFSNQAKIL